MKVEAVVIDGASTDGTAAWLEQTRSRIPVMISEPDRGIYDAMNKGVAAAHGEWILFLGADDRIADSTVLARLATRLVTTEADVVSGVALFNDARRYPPGKLRHAVHRNFLHHQATVYRRRLWTEHGNFDAGLRLMGDYDFNLRLLKAGALFEGVETVVTICASGGASDAGSWRGYREEITVRHRHFPASHCWLWDVGSVVRYLRKKIRRSLARKRPE